MIRYEAFYRQHVARRTGDLSVAQNISDIKELPQGSILHVVDNFNMVYENGPLMVPDIRNPLYALTARKKLVLPIKQFVNTKISPDSKGIKVLSLGVDKALLQFKQLNSPDVKLVTSDMEFKHQSGTQNVVCYNSLYNTRMTGILRRARHVKNVLATILNTAAAMKERQHFIHIPLTNLTFSKTDFERTFKEQSKSSIKFPEVPHYLFLMQLYSFIESRSTASLFDGLDKESWKNINFVLTVEDKVIIYRLDVLKEINGPSNNAMLRIIEHVNKLAPVFAGDVPVAPIAPQTLTSIKPTGDAGLNTAGFTAQPTVAEVEAVSAQNIEEMDTKAEEAIDKTPNITPKQKERAKVLAKAYKEVTIDGVPIEAILVNSNDHTIEGGELDFLEDELIDDSMKKSSVDTFDVEYMEKTFKKDMAASLVSLSSQGMFLTGFKSEDKSDESSKVIEYTTHFEDATGKKHTIKFTFPKVDRNGLCKINGQTKSMKLQRVNVPIVKDSAVRVLLNSNFNKTLVERNVALSHNFYAYLKKMLSKAPAGDWGFSHGTFEYNHIPLPYEYTAIAAKMSKLYTKDFEWMFDYENRHKTKGSTGHVEAKLLREQSFGVYIGSGGIGNKAVEYYLSTTGDLTKVLSNLNPESEVIAVTTIIDEVAESLDLKPKPLTEWVDFKILAKKVTVAFALCYRFGLTHMLNYLNADFSLYEPNERIKTKVSDVVVRFKDKKLVIKATPKHVALIFSGLTKYKILKDVYFEAMDEKDVYYDIIQRERMSINYLKGIDTIFELFVDPITADILTQMGEPTNMKDLLIRATVLLTTQDHLPKASSANFRYRSYERFVAIAYKKMARALATYQNGSIGAGKKFSMSQFEIMSEIMKDPLMESVDTINPINDVKGVAGYSHIGEGGRSSEAMVIDDRQFPDDAVGIMSEATVDSGKVAIDGMLSVDPTIVNTRGLTITKPIEELEAANILSATTLLIPSADQDDGKRANFINIQMSQYANTKESGTSRLRTGFERVLPHRTRLPFAYPAEENGVVEAIDMKAGTITIKYKKSGEVYVLNWGQEYTNNGGGGFHCTQNVALNKLKVGTAFKRGDILLYNKDYFAADPYSTQVDTKLGYHANVALLEGANTMEDGCIISRKLSGSLAANPVQVRTITIKRSTVIHEIAAEGSKVKSATPLIIFDDSNIPAEYLDNPDILDAIKKLNRSTPKAKYDGHVVKIEAFFKTGIHEMSESLAKIVRSISRKQNAKAKNAKGSTNQDEHWPKESMSGDRMGQITFDEDTVVLKFYVQQDLGMEGGDKVVFGGALKSVCSKIVEESMPTQDGTAFVEATIGASSYANRMTPSVMIMGATNRILEKMENDMIEMYFNDK